MALTAIVHQYMIDRRKMDDVDVALKIARLNCYKEFQMVPYPPTMSNGNRGVMMSIANAKRTVLVDVRIQGRVKYIENYFWDMPDYRVTEYERGKFLIEFEDDEIINPSTIEQI